MRPSEIIYIHSERASEDIKEMGKMLWDDCVKKAKIPPNKMLIFSNPTGTNSFYKRMTPTKEK